MFLSYLFIGPVILCLVLYTVARHNADYTFLNVFFVSAIIGLGNLVLVFLLVPKLGLWTYIAVFLFSAIMLIRYCYVTFVQASIVLLIYLIVNLGLGLTSIDLLG